MQNDGASSCETIGNSCLFSYLMMFLHLIWITSDLALERLVDLSIGRSTEDLSANHLDDQSFAVWFWTVGCKKAI